MTTVLKTDGITGVNRRASVATMLFLRKVKPTGISKHNLKYIQLQLNYP